MYDWNKAPLFQLPEEEKEEKTVPNTGEIDWNSVPLVSTPQERNEEARGLTRDQIISDPQKMGAIRNYMVQRKGVNWEYKEPEELFDAYMGHMRFVNANEVRTVGEALYIQRADAEKKASAADAYMIYDEIAPFWESGEGAGALIDYGKAVLTSPSTYLGAVAGKFISGAGSAAARQAILQTAKEATKRGGVEAGKAVLAAAARQDALRVGLTATGVDALMAGAQDYTLQKNVMMESGAQDEYSMTQTAISLLGGLAGGAVGMVPELRRGTLGISAEAIEEAKVTRKAASRKVAAERIKASVNDLVERLKATAGPNPGIGGPNLEQITNDMSWFFDADNPDSIIRIIVDSGADLKIKDEEGFTKQIVDFIKNLPEKQLKEINDVLEPALGFKLGELIDRVAVGQSGAGSILNIAGQAKRYAEDMAQVTAAKRSANRSVIRDMMTPKDAPSSPEYARYMASLWRRMLVSHPATTAVNVQGWGIAHYARSMAEMVNGSLYGTVGLVGKTMGRQWGDDALKQAKASWGNQIFKAKTLLDPYEAKEGFDALLANAPKNARERMNIDTFGGVEGKNAPAMFGINNPNRLVRGAESVANLAAKASMINIQDYWTKTFSALGELDLQARKTYGKGLDQLVKDGEYFKITDEMWEKATRTLLQDTFSMDYTKGRGLLSGAANIVEKFSNLPYFGFLFPFGRFMNNNIAFTLQYSPLALLPLATKMGRKGTEDIGQTVSRAIVGTVGLATMINYSMKMREQGHQWFEVEESTGDVTTEQNMAPISQFRLLGRIFDRIGQYVTNGEAVPVDLWKELASQLGPQAWAKELTGETPIGALVETLARAGDTDQEAVGFGSLLGAALQALSGQVLSGFTRPLDPINKMAGLFTETDASIDRRQADSGGERIKLELMRYADNLFDAVLSEPVGTTMRSATRPEGDIHDPNALASLIGRKEMLPKNYIDKVLGMTDYPAYLLDQRSGIPEADRFMNEQVAPILNARAKELLKDEVFINGNMSIKRAMVKMMLEKSRDYIRDLLGAGYIGTAENRLENARRIWLSQPVALRDQAKKDLGIKTNDRNLSEGELHALRQYVGNMSKFLNNRVD